MKYLKAKKQLLIIILITLIILLLSIKVFNQENEVKSNQIVLEKTTKKINVIKIFIDIKGEVKKPGVYQFKENDRVIDAIKLAGGLTKNANTNNINLSQKLKNEMVIYISNKKELNKTSICNETCKTEIIEINNCAEINKEESSQLININSSTKEILMNIEGIGESKADNIIKYREEFGLFKNIEDIKNVTGIGDTIFNSIKDKITI